MGTLRLVIGYALAALSVAAIVWGAVAAQPVPGPPRAVLPSPAELLVNQGPRVSDTDPPEIATKVEVLQPRDADLERVAPSRLDVGQRQIKLVITHTLTADPDETRLLNRLRERQNFPGSLRAETDELFGPIVAEGGTELTPTARFAPQTVTSGGRTTVTYGLVMMYQTAPGALLTLRFEVPTGRPLWTASREISVVPGQWRVVSTPDFVPDVETPDLLKVSINPNPVRLSLAHGRHEYVEAVKDDEVSWSAALGVATALVMAVLLLRALGGSWWRRRRNRWLAAGVALCAAVVALSLPIEPLHLAGYVMLFVVLPILTLRHAIKVVPGPAPWTTTDLLVVTAAAVAVGGGMLLWSGLYGQLPLATLLGSGTVAALSAAGSAVAFGADLGSRQVTVRLALIAAGVALGALAFALWMRALMTAVYPPDSVRLVLALAWSLIPVAGIAVMTRQWSRPVVVFGVLAGLLVQGWPAEWLDAESWSVAGQPGPPDGLDPVLRGAQGLLLLAFVLMVLRLRRLGTSPDVLGSSAVQATMMVTLLAVYLTPREGALDVGVTLPSLAITSLMAWGGASWLISGLRPEFVEPDSPAEHRDLVRKALHQRLLFQAKQELYRLGRGKLGAGEMSLDDFDERRRDLNEALGSDSHRPETAFATAAACSPWHNGVMAFVVTLVLTLPFAFIFGLPAGSNLSEVAFDARGLLSLPVFGFLYGYFYPKIRGTQPMTKALHLMAAATATELSAYLTALFEPDIGAADKIQLIAIVVGQTSLACIGLGLYWEWRIMHLAGEPWGRVRNVRSVRSLATPLLAVVIAAGTTAATSVAGKTVDRILKGDGYTSQQKD
ncbi:hypothetical protein ACIBG7_24290 [Nonomuraea sp. NPDC050328]|uniref:hypothetical protein n=1 Tax=Nonomuraea sp. NPDC050328 TaxID=3364361 RepID=UPI00379112A6